MNTEIIQIVFSNLAKLMPWRVINDYERGVRWFLGTNPRPLKPGLRRCMWFFERVEQFSVVEQTINLPTQSVVTAGADGLAVCFSANITIEILDPVKYWCEVQNFVESVRDLASGFLHEAVHDATYTELMTPGGLSTLQTALEGSLSAQLSEWGANVTRVHFTDFTPVSQQVRLFQDQPAMKVF